MVAGCTGRDEHTVSPLQEVGREAEPTLNEVCRPISPLTQVSCLSVSYYDPQEPTTVRFWQAGSCFLGNSPDNPVLLLTLFYNSDLPQGWDIEPDGGWCNGYPDEEAPQWLSIHGTVHVVGAGNIVKCRNVRGCAQTE